MNRDFSPKQVAKALNVSESSVKRWCDRGVIATQKTTGGHRRITCRALGDFLQKTSRQVVDHSVLEQDADAHDSGNSLASDFAEPLDLPVPVGTLQQRLHRELLRGDEAGARLVVMQFFTLADSVARLADELIAPVFRNIGELWHRGEVEVFVERRAVTIMVHLIGELRRLLPSPGRNAPVAIGGALSGDHYDLPTLLVDCVLRQCGYRTINLGTNLPVETLAAAIEHQSADFGWVSVSAVSEDNDLRRQMKYLFERLPSGVMLLLGGRGFDAEGDFDHESCVRFHDLAELERFVQKIESL